MKDQDLKSFLDEQVDRFNTDKFIPTDPISVVHKFSKKQDIEIIGFWVAMLAWGQRVTIINKANELIDLMDGSPYDFIKNHKEIDRKRFETFKHRTFNYTDTLYFLEFLQHYYKQENSLEKLFAKGVTKTSETIQQGLINFHETFFSLPDAPHRTKKHVSTPKRKSTCKRLNMYLRWMVRKDKNGVDFGIWKSIKPSQLLMPLDVHVDKVARQFGLITRKQRDWQTVIELTDKMRAFDPKDPVKYDYALFGMSALKEASDFIKS